MTRRVSRWLLRGLTAAVPVVIAACYGMAYRYSRAGKVVDASTAKGIPGVSVTCIDNGVESAPMVTTVDGEFRTSGPCNELRVQDTDGADHGSYPTKTVPVSPGGDEIRIALDPAK